MTGSGEGGGGQVVHEGREMKELVKGGGVERRGGRGGKMRRVLNDVR